MRIPRPPCAPLMAAITENSRIHTAQTLRRALSAMGYPLTNRTADLFTPYKWLREHGWVTRYTGTNTVLHCAPDVTAEEARCYCKAHGIPATRLTGEPCKHVKRPTLSASCKHEALAAVVRAISGTYARVRYSNAWRAA